MEATDLAYLAGVIDVRGNITTRRAAGTLLPLTAVSTKETRLLEWLCSITDMRMVTTERAYARGGCALHCAEKHVHISSVSGRWSVTGAKATIVLAAVRPFLRLQADEADLALAVGLKAPHKPASLSKMAALGWPMPKWWLTD